MKVGDYVRTKDDIEQTIIITKIITMYEDCIVGEDKCLCGYENIIKSSPNIVDLIEVGDYVNGSKVIRIEESSYVDDNKMLMVTCEGSDDYNSYFEEEIKSIVTKEQFESMQYKVGD